MNIIPLGGASEVGASCTLLQVAGHTLLIDGGMRPAARPGQSRLPDLHLLDTTSPEALIITHAHIDHTGALPLIASLYPQIPIYATESTRVLTEILLRDSVRIMEQEGLKPDGETPLYNADQVDALLGRIQPMGFEQPFAPIASAPITIQYLHAGHILGAGMLYVQTPEGTLLHTGDISVTDQRTIKGLDLQKLPQADAMICEGTYGDRSHTNRKEEERKLAETIQATLARGGRVLCPAFAVGRAQEVLLILKSYRASGQVSPVPIYLDGMVRSVCVAYQQQSHDLHPSLQRYLANARRPLFADPDLRIFSVRSPDRQALIARNEPMVVISSSGMLSGGASPLYAAEIAPREQDCILFTGYQDEESPGAALLRAKQGDHLQIGERSFFFCCQVARYNLSGHADGDQIVHAVTKVQPKQVILVHGAPEALENLARRFSKIQVLIPTVGERIQIVPQTTLLGSKTAGTLPAVVPSAGTDHTNKELSPLPLKEPPTIRDLWELALQHGSGRPWTAVELGQHLYGSAYRPALRPQIEQILREAAPYFKQGRLGATPTYQPRKAQEVEQLRPLTQLGPGEIVLAQGTKGAPAQLALLLSAPADGTVSILSDQWKQATRPMKVIQLVPGLQRSDLLALSTEAAKQALQMWRKRLDEIWIDLFVQWKQCQPFTYHSLIGELPSDDDLRLAWGLELLTHGDALFHQEDSLWTPLEEQRIKSNTGFLHHLELLRAGRDAPVLANGQRGKLTGKSNWRLFEVRRDEGEDAGELARVRSGNIQLEQRSCESSKNDQ